MRELQDARVVIHTSLKMPRMLGATSAQPNLESEGEGINETRRWRVVGCMWYSPAETRAWQLISIPKIQKMKLLTQKPNEWNRLPVGVHVVAAKGAAGAGASQIW